MGKGGKGKGGKGGKGKGRPPEPEGPPEAVEEIGEAVHACEDDLVCKCTNERVPHFNARMFLENNEEIGRLDEIFGPINCFYFSVKLGDGMKAASFKAGKKIYIDNMKLLPMQRFLPQPPISKTGKGGKGKGKDGKGKGKGKVKGKGKGKDFGKGKGKPKGGTAVALARHRRPRWGMGPMACAWSRPGGARARRSPWTSLALSTAAEDPPRRDARRRGPLPPLHRQLMSGASPPEAPP
eukprot:CAMPEP_0168360506 /NCGR_PEP_ID=MMETSP0228-20121227/2196_1 /TAXON_ID=133427 /ORGANISM="Protoceratium reticulatum, Strain CCCM 535 (=CCMP 1889)" /LENGTH=237 /DNA_ID=CAMNT_0008373175 /DNA_START=51 /DNA_END=763 /DNA_ORIENTATION=+